MNFVKHFIKYFLLKIKFAGRCKFDFSCSIDIHSNFEGMNKIYENVNFSGSLGFGSYIGRNCSLNAKIGRFCSIADNVITNTGSHPYQNPFVSTSPCFFSLSNQNGKTFATEQVFQEFRYVDRKNKYGIVIENDVWICSGAFINPGITISNGAVVFAHAVVTKDIPPYAIVGGVPAKILGYRYDAKTINWLQKIQWWNNDFNWFEKKWRLMTNIDELRAYYNEREN